MSRSARRLPAGIEIRPLAWSVTPGYGANASAQAGEPEKVQQAQLAAIERDAFAKGYEQGERAGTEAGSKRAEAMLRRLSQTLEELADLRRTMIRTTEKQIVELALAIARRVVRREVSLDHELTMTLARVALERLGENVSATVRLHPEDYSAVAGRLPEWTGSHVNVVADASVSRGGCRVESDFGFVDASIDAQLTELARALLQEEESEGHVVVSFAR